MGFRTALPDPGQAHVWFVELAANPATVAACSRTLSADETERAFRFRAERLRTGFTLARGILRELLGRYLAIEPGRVAFAYGQFGKPRVALPESSLRFNLAHSGGLAAYAFAAGCEVGVDIERMRPRLGREEIVRRFFSPEEREEWLGLDLSRRDEAFFRGWTGKEAYIKALGSGLSTPLDGFRVRLAAGAAAAPVRMPGDAGEAGKWRVVPLAPADGYAGSLAIPEGIRGVRVLPRLTAEAALALAGSGEPFPPAGRWIEAGARV